MKIKDIILFASGVDRNVLKECSTSEENRFLTLGTLIFVPFITSIIAAAFACRYFTQNPVKIGGICIIWGVLVFIIERALISNLRPRTFNLAVLFRVILAVAMSIVTSELLVLYVYKKDIAAHIGKEYDADIEAIHKKYDIEIQAITKELSRKADAVDLQESRWISEVEGTSGTFTYGNGPVAKLDSIVTARKLNEYELAKGMAEERIAAIREREAKALASIDRRKEPGILNSQIGLEELAAENHIVKRRLWTLRILFLSIELMPLMIKIFSGGRQYYDMLDRIEDNRLKVEDLLSEDEIQSEVKQRQLEFYDKMLNHETDKLQKELLANENQYNIILSALVRISRETERTLNELESNNPSLADDIKKLHSEFVQAIAVAPQGEAVEATDE